MGATRVLTKCKFCNQEFMVVAFELKRGRGLYCSRSCRSKVISANRLKNNPPKGPSKTNYERNKIQRLKFPEKYQAVLKVKGEIKVGRLVRMPCEKCGDIKSQAHHEDYSKPLDVIWLCEIHHKQRHKELRLIHI